MVNKINSRLVVLAMLATVATTVGLLTRLATPAEAAFPGDNGNIVFVRNQGGDTEIRQMGKTIFGNKKLTDNSAEDFAPAVSPDGTRIAFTSDRHGNYDVYAMNKNGTGQTRLTSSPASDAYPAFSADGERIVFQSDRDGENDQNGLLAPEIYVMDVDGTEETRLTHDAGGAYDPSFSPNGSEIAFTSTRAGYRALTWDPRGHGLSKPVGDVFSVEGASEDLLAILDRLGTTKAFLVGQSLGGNVTQELVFRHPERVSGLVVIGCTCNTILPSRLGLLALKASPLAFRLWPYSDLKRRTATSISASPDVQEYVREAMSMGSRKEFLAIWDAAAHTLHEEPGYRIEHPLLITHGEQDRLGNIAKIAPDWAARDPNSRYVIVPGAGHNANQDNPTFFNRLLLEFLDEH